MVKLMAVALRWQGTKGTIDSVGTMAIWKDKNETREISYERHMNGDNGIIYSFRGFALACPIPTLLCDNLIGFQSLIHRVSHVWFKNSKTPYSFISIVPCQPASLQQQHQYDYLLRI
jgi:hypothetical protein